MAADFSHVMHDDFLAFVEKAFKESEGTALDPHPYLQLLCGRLAGLEPGARHMLNLPPRHLKSFLASICFPAWSLGRDPRRKIMIIAGSEQLAESIARQIREILRAAWFAKAFPLARLSRGQSQKTDFALERGGEVFATSIRGKFTGRGADLFIVDDPLDITDASNIEKIEGVNRTFDDAVTSRLNSPKAAIVLLIMHRLHPSDLSGHVFEQGGWERTVLPLIATRTTTYDLGHDVWRRRKGELLRPDAFSAKDIKRLQKNTRNPDFELLYQQNAMGPNFRPVKRKHFGTFNERPDAAVVLSIDATSGGTGANASFDVVQAWSRVGEEYFLIDQWRARATYAKLRERALKFIGRYRPSAILIERAGNGVALASELYERRRNVIELVPTESKVERFRAVAGLIRAGRVKLFEFGTWRHDFVDELVRFPAAPNNDQVDAAAHALAWLRNHPHIEKPVQPGLGAIAHRGTMPAATSELRGAVLTHGRSITGAFTSPRANYPIITPRITVHGRIK
jgi:phage terminase large subunit-like protein